MLKNVFQSACKLHRQNLENQTTYKWRTADNTSKYSSNPRTFSNMQKNIWKLYTKETTSKAATNEFLFKTHNRKKICNERFNLCQSKISLDEIIKSINSQTNNKLLGNDGLTAKFYKHFSNELGLILLDV